MNSKVVFYAMIALLLLQGILPYSSARAIQPLPQAIPYEVVELRTE